MIGLLGGTFDPVHFGHLRPARQVCDSLGLSAVRFIPAARPPHRPAPIADFEHRRQMLNLALPMYERFELDDREQRLGGISYTVHTLESLRTELGEQQSLGLIVGADQFAAFESWNRWQEIIELAHLVVINRPGIEVTGIPDWARGRLTQSSQSLASSAGGGVVFVEVTPLDISASDIRAALLAGQPVTGLVPEPVLKYIEANRLYR